VSASQSMPLSADEIARITHRARRAGCANSWTGTSGALAADVQRLLAERLRLLAEIARMSERDTQYWRQAHD